ncbi:WYL domain-containing protein [Pseudomonas sp. LFM046]|uniref:WYL domain-containing protein n=1 Tax=Pseudomonas sp. LFM046 TaxID=1608357 RepID=UPI0011AF3E27|nr:WYL domain-containing protein [Pseudomonas sp. LFM046]
MSAANLQPTLTRGVFSEYQRLIGAAGSLDAISAGVPFESSQLDATAILPTPFSRLHRAMRLGLCVKLVYRSMNNPEAHERLIRPHSLIQAGPRWHLRAYCEKAGDYRDFNRGRISAVSLADDRMLPGVEQDQNWHRMVSVRLVPHRGLSAEQAQMVREEYMGGPLRSCSMSGHPSPNT